MEVEVMNAKRDKNASFVRGMSLNTILVAVGLIGLGVFWSINHDGCGNILTPPLIGIGAALFIISIIGFLGALKYNLILLCIYLVLLGFIFTVLLVLTVTGFIVTSHDPGHPADGLRYKEYQLQDCSSWLRKMLNNRRTWENFKSCFVVPSDCGVLSKIYRTPEQYKLAELGPIHAGCCRPPSECGYPVINASYYNLSVVSMSAHKDCKLYKNSEAIKCFDCDSCKAGVAQYLNLTWRWSLIDFVVFLFVLILLIKCVCSVRRNAEKARLRRVYVFPNDVPQERV